MNVKEIQEVKSISNKNVIDKPKEPSSATIPKKKDASLSPLPKKEEKKNPVRNTMKISKILIQSNVFCFFLIF